MDNQLNRLDLHKIVILNPKGGSGKTTLATNVASYFAKRGPPPTLADCDPNGYSMRWLSNRPAKRAQIHGVAAPTHCSGTAQNRQLHAWPESRHLIVDLPAALPDDELYNEIYDANSILIPVMPSSIDIYAAARFIANLLLVAQVDRRDRNLAIVANRTRQRTRSYRMLIRFLTSLNIPVIAQLRDSQNFVQAAADGIGICEMPEYKVGKDLEQLNLIIDWLDKWRMRKLDAAASVDFEHMPSAEILTPAYTKGHH